MTQYKEEQRTIEQENGKNRLTTHLWSLEIEFQVRTGATSTDTRQLFVNMENTNGGARGDRK
jgi:hypothetical protein